jgi:hypothetical protein
MLSKRLKNNTNSTSMPSDDKLQNFKHAQLLFFNARNGIYHSFKKLVEYFIKLIYIKKESPLNQPTRISSQIITDPKFTEC